MNVQCTHRIVKILKTCPNLKSYVHISTAFVNSDRHKSVVEEIVYPSNINYKDMEATLKWMGDDQVEGILDYILDKRFPWKGFIINISFLNKYLTWYIKYLHTIKKYVTLYKISWFCSVHCYSLFNTSKVYLLSRSILLF